MTATVDRTAINELVHTRSLTDQERPYPSCEPDVPLVIEPKRAGHLAFLRRFLAEHHEAVLKLLYEQGAVLLRGFDVRNERDLEAAVRSIRGLRPMNSYFMSETGRTPVNRAPSVFATSTFLRTGGDFHFGNFHTENYYSPDIPHLQALCCLKAPRFGGETALIQMANAYEGFDRAFQSRLESQPCVSKCIPVSAVGARYQLPDAAVEQFCEENGIPVADAGGSRWLCITKPNVFQHPYVDKRSLQVSLSFEVGGLDRRVLDHFREHYRGLRWSLHRAAWKHARVGKLLSYLHHLPLWAGRPRVLMHYIVKPCARSVAAALGRKAPVTRDGGMPKVARFGDLLKPQDVEALSDAIAKHASVFTWKRGDILLFDNLQVLHSGMPGLGPRLMRVMLFNPVPIDYPVETGLLRVRQDSNYVSRHDRIVKFIKERKEREERGVPNSPNGRGAKVPLHSELDT